jgi:hypothetical protein
MSKVPKLSSVLQFDAFLTHTCKVYCYPRWYVCTTRVYVLLCCCCCCCCCWHGHINQNTALLSNFTHAFSILLHHYIQPCLAALRVLARQPCARLPGSLACACPAAFCALAWQPFARLPGSLARAAVQTNPNRFSRILHRTL